VHSAFRFAGTRVSDRTRRGHSVASGRRDLRAVARGDSGRREPLARARVRPAAAAGLRAGDVITAIGGQPLARREDALQVIRQRADALPAGGGVLQVTVLRNRAAVPLTLRFSASSGPAR
jgi:S1-C subfamily serine protease